jgi:hypothetical protein
LQHLRALGVGIFHISDDLRALREAGQGPLA